MTRVRLSPTLVRAFQVAVALGLLVLVWRVADGAEAARLLASARPGWIAAAFGALTLQTVISALRWRLTAGQFGIRLARVMALREYYLSQIVNQALPGGVLGDAGRAVRARAQAGLAASGLSVVFERLAGQIAIFVLMAGAFLATFAVPGGLDWPNWLATPLLAAVAAAVALPPLLVIATRVLPGRIGRGVRQFGGHFVRALVAPAVRWRQAGLSLGTALCNVAAFGFCAWAVGAALSPEAALVLVPLILFTMIVPLTVSGWGLREGAAAALFPLAGATASEGLATSVAFGLVMLAALVPGALLVLMSPAPQTESLESGPEARRIGTIDPTALANRSHRHRLGRNRSDP